MPLRLSLLGAVFLVVTPVGQIIPRTPTDRSVSQSLPPATFLVPHREGHRLYLEIPRRTLNTDLLVLCHAEESGTTPRLPAWRGRCRGTALDTLGASAFPNWRFTQDGNSVVINAAVSIRFPILRFGPDSAPVIDVTSLLLSNKGTQAEIHTATAHSTRVEVELAQRVGASTVTLHWTLVRLPNRPVPFGRSQFNDYIPTLCGIRRLEKRDPWAASSDVVNPIVYTIDTGVPKQWVPYVKRGLEEWNAAFDAIGFHHAIIAVREGEDLPQGVWIDVPEDRVTWYKITPGAADTGAVPVQWSVASVKVTDTLLLLLGPNAGTSSHNDTDPDCDSNGEIIGAPIRIGSNSPAWISNSYFDAAAATDPTLRQQAQTSRGVQCFGDGYCPVPDSVIGLGIQQFVAHEMGHALGLDHNYASRWTYPTDSLRSRAFVDRMGITPTVMDYSFWNYVAQPEDHLPSQDLIKRVGLYDRWAIAWLYRPIPGAFTLEAERPTLKQWQVAQDTAPYLHGVNNETPQSGDPGLTYIGANRIKAAEYRLRNLARTATMFDISRDGVMGEWVRGIKEAGYRTGDMKDSAGIVDLMHFYLEHVVLGHDPLFQAKGLTWSTAPQGWDLSIWRRRRGTLSNAILVVLRSLASSPQQSIGVRTGVCHQIRAAIATLASERASADSINRAHSDSVQTRLKAIVTDAACADKSP